MQEKDLAAQLPIIHKNAAQKTQALSVSLSKLFKSTLDMLKIKGSARKSSQKLGVLRLCLAQHTEITCTDANPCNCFSLSLRVALRTFYTS